KRRTFSRPLQPMPLSPFLSPSPSPPQIYTLSLHDALPISVLQQGRALPQLGRAHELASVHEHLTSDRRREAGTGVVEGDRGWSRAEEHTSELQSRFDLVCRLLLEKKKNRKRPCSTGIFRYT